MISLSTLPLNDLYLDRYGCINAFATLKSNAHSFKAFSLKKSFSIARIFVLMFSFFQISTLNAQSGYTCNSCTANDVSITSIELLSTDLNPAYNATTNPNVDKYLPLPLTCVAGSPMLGYIKITLDQNATTRYGIYVTGDLYVDNVKQSSFAKCDGSDFVKNTNDKFYLNASAISFNCGSLLQLKNVFVGWGNSAADDICNNLCKIGPHCNKDVINLVFTVVTPLSADFSYSGDCTTGNVISFDALDLANQGLNGTTGGTSPYPSGAYSWSIVKTTDPIVTATMSGASPTFDFSTLGAGSYYVTLTVNDDAPNASSIKTKTVTVASCCTSPNAGTSGTLTICTGSTLTEAQLFAVIGTHDAGGLWSPALAGAGTYTYTVTATAPCTNATAQVVVTANPNSLCTVYSGDYFANTGSTAMGGSANVMLKYTVSADPNAICNNISGLTAANLTISSDANSSVSYGAIAYNTNTKVVTIPATISVPGNAYSISVTFTLGTTSDYSISGLCTDNPVVTVSSNSEGFVTGGGFIIPLNSGGTIGEAPVNGLKNNFGFNIKTNKAGKLQGNWNTVIRRREAGKVVVYQVKSNNANKLYITQVPGTKRYRADMTFTSANFKNLTCALCPVDANNGTVEVTVYDNGEPGANVDQILITVKDKTGSTWYKSDKAANHSLGYTNLQLLNQGNIQIHTLSTRAATNSATTSSEVDVAPMIGFNLQALPNPSTTSFNLRVHSDNSRSRMQIRVMDISGRTVQTIGSVIAGQTLQFGSTYRPGVYIVELIQGNKRKQVKLVKL